MAKDTTRPSYLRLVVGVAKDTDAVLSFLKEKVEPIYEESEGLQVTGAVFDGSSAISWNFWDSEEDMNAAVEKLNSLIDAANENEATWNLSRWDSDNPYAEPPDGIGTR